MICIIETFYQDGVWALTLHFMPVDIIVLSIFLWHK